MELIKTLLITKSKFLGGSVAKNGVGKFKGIKYLIKKRNIHQ